MGEQEENWEKGKRDEVGQHTGHVFMLQRKKKTKLYLFSSFQITPAE